MIIHTIRLPKQSTVGDVINELKTKVVLSTCNLVVLMLHAYLRSSHIKAFFSS